jgi:purine-binding chemotaxis protein CheW
LRLAYKSPIEWKAAMNHHAKHHNHHAQSHAPGARPLTPDTATVALEELSRAELVEIWARRAAALAEPPLAEPDGQSLDLLVFRLGQEQYGLEVTYAREIYPLEQITPVPRTPDFVAGVFSARGRLISVIELRAFLGLPTPPPPHSVNGAGRGGATRSRIVIVAMADLEVGLLVDGVEDVLTIFRADLEPALMTQMGSRAEFVQGIAPGMLVVLNLKVLLNDRRLIVHEGDKK